MQFNVEYYCIFYTSNSMRYYAICIFGLVAIRSFATGYDGCNSEVNLTIVNDVFDASAKLNPVPVYEDGNKLFTTFKRTVLNAYLHVAEVLQRYFYHSALEVARDFIHNVQIRRRNLQNAIDKIGYHKEPYCLDDYLNSLKNQCDILLELTPGNALIKRQGLPELPPNLFEITNFLTPPTLSQFFLRFYDVVEDNFKNAYNVSTGLLLSGWSAARLIESTLQTQYRNEILNGQILKFVALVLNELLEDCDLIRSHVTEKTWREFKVVADRIIDIFDDWVRSRKNQNCPI